jgi:hypothetical protein
VTTNFAYTCAPLHYRVLEEYDEDLTEAIQKGVLDQNGK